MSNFSKLCNCYSSENGSLLEEKFAAFEGLIKVRDIPGTDTQPIGCVLFIFCCFGCIVADVEGETIVIPEGHAIYLMPWSANVRIPEQSFTGTVLVLSKEFCLSSIGYGRMGRRNGCHRRIYPIPEDSKQVISDFSGLSLFILRGSSAKKEVRLMQMTRAICSADSDEGAEDFKTDPILKSFVSLLERECVSHKKISFYSKALSVSSGHLSNLLREKTGRSFSEWERLFIAVKAKNHILKTDLSMSQIAEELGFESCASFSRFFKSFTGLPPTQYREINGQLYLKH